MGKPVDAVESRLLVCDRDNILRLMVGPKRVIRHGPSSGSLKTRPKRSDPSALGLGRSLVGGYSTSS
jgi:hypothetical protein